MISASETCYVNLDPSSVFYSSSIFLDECISAAPEREVTLKYIGNTWRKRFPFCRPAIGRNPPRTLGFSPFIIAPPIRQSPREVPPPEVWNKPCACHIRALFAQTASFAPSSSGVRLCCGALRAGQTGQRWQEPRGTGQTNMDLRKTMMTVLWILLLNPVEDSHAEEGV